MPANGQDVRATDLQTNSTALFNSQFPMPRIAGGKNQSTKNRSILKGKMIKRIFPIASSYPLLLSTIHFRATSIPHFSIFHCSIYLSHLFISRIHLIRLSHPFVAQFVSNSALNYRNDFEIASFKLLKRTHF